MARRPLWSALFGAAAISGLLLGQPLAARSAQEQPPVADVLERYGHGQFDAAIADLTRDRKLGELEPRFRREAGRWLTESGEWTRGKRLAIVSALALELVASSFDRDRGEYNAVRPLIEWACGLLRQVPPSEFERLFHLASIGLLQGVRDEEMLAGARVYSDQSRHEHVLHGGGRFPQESRFKLAWVTTRLETQFIASWPLSPGHLLQADSGRVRAEPAEARTQFQETLATLGRLVGDPRVGYEARLRRGVLRFVMGAPADALPDLRDAAGSGDPFIEYLSHVMQGLVLERTGRLADAIEHYQSAMRVVPATAASLALASALFREGRGSEAAQLVSTWASTPRPEDPWRLYGLRDYRLFPGFRADMRRMIHP